MPKSRFLICILLLVFCGELAAQEPEIAIQPYKADVDVLTGEVRAWGQMIVHRGFEVELEEGVRSVPILAIQYEGLHHVKGAGPATVEARAKCIAERLAVAWDLLANGATLKQGVDDWRKWRLKGEAAPTYPAAPTVCPAIYLHHASLGENPLRIMTVYPEDAARFPRVKDGIDLAEYLIAVIQAHHLLFSAKSSNIADYEQLEIDQTREGKIFKEIFIRADEVKTLRGEQKLNNATIKDALARVALPQRQRLVNMAIRAPRDWQNK